MRNVSSTDLRKPLSAWNARRSPVSPRFLRLAPVDQRDILQQGIFGFQIVDKVLWIQVLAGHGFYEISGEPPRTV